MNCMVPGCPNEARNLLGVRLRKPTTLAVYAPNCDAFLCKAHAEAGGSFEIKFIPRSLGTIETVVYCGGQEIARRDTPIRRRAA